MNGTCIVIPGSLHDGYLRYLHTGHFSISKFWARAKSTVYWPGIDKDITNFIGCCDTCRQVQHGHPTYDEHSVEACYPAHVFGSDIVNIDGKPHVVVVDYYSFCLYERPIPDTSSDTLILALKTILVSLACQLFWLQKMEGSIAQKSSSNLAWIGLLYIRHHPHITPKEIHMLNALQVLSKKCIVNVKMTFY